MWQIQKGFALESRQPNPANTVQKLISANSQNDQPHSPLAPTVTSLRETTLVDTWEISGIKTLNSNTG